MGKRPAASADRERILGYLMHRVYPRWWDRQPPRTNEQVPVGAVVVVTHARLFEPVHTVGILLTPWDSEGFQVRDVASDFVTNWSNAGIAEVKGVSADDDAMQYGNRARFIERTHKAFRRGNEYSYRYGGVEFSDDTAQVLIRRPFSQESFPTAPVKVHSRTTIREILEAMVAAGYGTRPWAVRSIHDDGSRNTSPEHPPEMP